jgi:hypothetical protein
MTEQQEAVARTLVGIAKTHNKFYCFCSRETLCLLLKKYHHLNVSQRTMSRRIKELHDQGYIIRVRRNWEEVNGSKKFNCNLYYLQKKLFLWLKRLGEYVRKVFSHFHVPTLAYNSLRKHRGDLEGAGRIVEILWKTDIKGRASPVTSETLPGLR